MPTLRSIALTCALLAAPAPGAAASDPGSSRTEGGHVFILSEFVPAPFATTEFAMLTGVGFADADISGTPLTALVLAQTTRLQVAPVPWLALRVAATGSALAGADQDSALTIGGRFGHTLGAGAQLSLPLGFLRLGASLDVEKQTLYAFSILSAIEASVRSNRVDASTLLAKSDAWTVRPGAQVAVGLGQTLGVYGRVAYERTSSTPEGGATSTANAFLLGGAASVDFRPGTGIPVGLLGTYDLQYAASTDSSPSSTVHRLGGGAFYTGRSSVSIGAEAQVEIHPDQDGFSMNVYSAYFGMRYYW